MGSLKRPRNGNQNFMLWRAMTWIYTTYWWTKIPVQRSWGGLKPKLENTSEFICHLHSQLIVWIKWSIKSMMGEDCHKPFGNHLWSGILFISCAVMMMLLARSTKPPINISVMQYHIISSIFLYVYMYIYFLGIYVCIHTLCAAPTNTNHCPSPTMTHAAVTGVVSIPCFRLARKGDEGHTKCWIFFQLPIPTSAGWWEVCSTWDSTRNLPSLRPFTETGCCEKITFCGCPTVLEIVLRFSTRPVVHVGFALLRTFQKKNMAHVTHLTKVVAIHFKLQIKVWHHFLSIHKFAENYKKCCHPKVVWCIQPLNPSTFMVSTYNLQSEQPATGVPHCRSFFLELVSAGIMGSCLCWQQVFFVGVLMAKRQTL